MEKPNYSIIIPTLNEEKFLSHLLTSLTEQTVKDFEVIVVDASPNQRTIDVAKRFSRKFPLTIVQCEKAGVSRQRNMGAAAAQSNWLVFVDADSVFLPQFIERVSSFIKKKKPDCFTTWFKADIDTPTYAILGFILNISIESMSLTKKPWVPGPMAIIRREVFTAIGGYNEAVTYAEDHEIGVALGKHGMKLDILREVLYIYSIRRFKQEGLLRTIDRGIRATAHVVLTNRGMKKMPGFVGGGSTFTKKSKKKKLRIISKEAEQSIKEFIKELIK